MATVTRNQPHNLAPIEQNFFGYRIVDNATCQTAHNVTAAFRYRGYEIAFNTFNPAGMKVTVLLNHVLIDECGTVEAAIAAVNEHAMHAQGWQRTMQSRDAVRGLIRRAHN